MLPQEIDYGKLKYVIMNKISFFVISLMIILSACKDDELMLQRTPYIGNELRIDGYYYEQAYNCTSVKFSYRNGVLLVAGGYLSYNIDSVEKQLLNSYEKIKHSKISWGVFVIKGSTIEYSFWDTSVGGGLPTYKSIGYIENDTTFCITRTINKEGSIFKRNDVYHFKQFSPKPDSTGAYQWIK